MIALSGLSKSYRSGALQVPVLRDISLSIERGEFVAVMGTSGSGKSTLMNIIGCLDSHDAGEFRFDDQSVGALGSDARARLRSRRIGFVFQSFNLVARMTALRNVELPMIYAGVGRAQRRRIASRRLEEVGLSDRTAHLPSQLSGGQQQRVAIARALANDPDLVIADEPTGSLDSQSSNEIMAVFDRLHASGRTIVMVTHEAAVAEHAERVVRLADGEVISEGRVP